MSVAPAASAWRMASDMLEAVNTRVAVKLTRNCRPPLVAAPPRVPRGTRVARVEVAPLLRPFVGGVPAPRLAPVRRPFVLGVDAGRVSELDVPAELPAGRRPRRPPRPVPPVCRPVAPAGPGLAVSVVDVRPRSAAPCRWATRYTDDSPIPNRLLISETGVSVSAYSRVTSRSCWSFNLRRVPRVPLPCVPREDSPSVPDSEVFARVVSVVSITSPFDVSKLTVCTLWWHMLEGGASELVKNPQFAGCLQKESVPQAECISLPNA